MTPISTFHLYSFNNSKFNVEHVYKQSTRCIGAPAIPYGPVLALSFPVFMERFDVDIRLDTVMQSKGCKAKCPLVVICLLELQLVDPDVVATAFQRTKCTILRAKKSVC